MEIFEDVGAEFACFGLGMDLESDFSDDAESTLAAEEQHGEIRTGSVAGHRKRTDDLTGRSNHFKRHYHIFDLAVFGGKHTGSAVGEKSAYRCAGDRGGQMHGGVSLLVASPLKMTGDHTGLAGDGQGLFVDAFEFIHAFHVKDDTAVDRQRTAL